MLGKDRVGAALKWSLPLLTAISALSMALPAEASWGPVCRHELDNCARTCRPGDPLCLNFCLTRYNVCMHYAVVDPPVRFKPRLPIAPVHPLSPGRVVRFAR